METLIFLQFDFAEILESLFLPPQKKEDNSPGEVDEWLKSVVC
jgi:hypothetical protein